MTSTTGLVPAAEPSAATLLKTDALGRMQRTREQRERILDEFERSGLSGLSFAALCGVKYQTFATWLQQRKRLRKLSPKRRPRRQPATRVQWLEASVQPAAASTATGLLLQLPGGVRAQISNEQHIALAAALVRALEKPC
ncbi:MAG TPA: IS66 family insertion sequence element accessory protein TnpB [Verrucomicrobiae bacterium]